MLIQENSSCKKKICKVAGCENKHLAKGLCQKHYWQMRYNTEPKYKERVLSNWRKYRDSPKGREVSAKWQREHRDIANHFREQFIIRWGGRTEVEASRNLHWIKKIESLKSKGVEKA